MKKIKMFIPILLFICFINTNIYADDIMDELDNKYDKTKENSTSSQVNNDIINSIIPQSRNETSEHQLLDEIIVETQSSNYLKERENVIKELMLINNRIAILNPEKKDTYIYSRPRENKKYVAYTNNKHFVEIIGLDKTNNWYYVCFNENQYGYVKKEDITTNNTYETIYSIINKNGNEYLELEQYKDFFNTYKKEIFNEFEETQISLLHYITINYETNEEKIVTSNELNTLREEIVNYACQFVGNPYVLGGTSLTKGADCSGFVMRVYSDYDIHFSRSLYHQYETGLNVNIDELEKGDLIFYGAEHLQHVAMYIGDGKVVHASTPKGGIKISNLKMMPIMGCQRIIY